MQDVMMYHDNLGLYLRQGNADYASWLIEGLDSTLHIINKKFDSHRKLDAPFETFYTKLLKTPINDIRTAVQKKEFPEAIIQYKILTKNCNGCHADHDVDKKVYDWTDPETH